MTTKAWRKGGSGPCWDAGPKENWEVKEFVFDGLAKLVGWMGYVDAQGEM